MDLIFGGIYVFALDSGDGGCFRSFPFRIQSNHDILISDHLVGGTFCI